MKLTAAICIALIFSVPAFSQESFYKVYEYETPLQGWMEVPIWNTYIAKSDLENGAREKLSAHSLEIEYGLLEHLAAEIYADFEAPADGEFDFTRFHIAGRYRFAQRYDWPVNTAFSAEYYFPNHAYSNSQQLEVRLILDRDIEDFRLIVNPGFSKYTTGDEKKDIEPTIAAGLYYRRFFFFQPGIEYYRNFEENSSVIFPAINFHFTPSIFWNVGVGFGTTNETDKLTIKSILTFEFMAIRPKNLF